MKKDSLISGNIGKALLLFVLPLIAGSLIQQLYTTVDAVIVGQFTGKIGLAAIDSVHTLFKLQVFWELSVQQPGLFFPHGCLILCLFRKKSVQDH